QDQPRQHIAAEVVGPERGRARRFLKSEERVRFVRVEWVRRQSGGQQRHDRGRQHDHEPDHAGGVAGELPQNQHESSAYTRGSISPWIRSPRMLTTEYTMPTRSVTARIAL